MQLPNLDSERERPQAGREAVMLARGADGCDRGRSRRPLLAGRDLRGEWRQPARVPRDVVSRVHEHPNSRIDEPLPHRLHAATDDQPWDMRVEAEVSTD